ncbi:hypothetical protein [Streptococcus suis]
MTKEPKLSLLLKSFENYRKTRDVEHLNDVERILEYDENDRSW